MRRISREALRTRIWVGLTVLPAYKQRAIGANEQRIREQITDDLVQRIMGDPASETVLLTPDMVGTVHSPRAGKWDVDEPRPHPEVLTTDDPRG
jgi:hypothetical protein